MNNKSCAHVKLAFNINYFLLADFKKNALVKFYTTNYSCTVTIVAASG
jgi:hypothetical protein